MTLAALFVPLLLLLVTPVIPGHWARRLLPLASLPALGLGLAPVDQTEVEWALLGLTLGVDPVSRPFLLLLGMAWSLAAWFAVGHVHEHVRSFCNFWLLTLAGIILTFLARDAVGFYCGYAVMTLAGYGLVLHDRSAEAARAGRVYLVLALFGEALIISGLTLLAARFGNPAIGDLAAKLADEGTTAAWFLFAGFAVKMGTLPLHVWLPLAHPVAPIPASAILSGVIVKAGLLGWLRFLPAEAFPTPAAGLLDPTLLIPTLVGLGLLGTFYAALMGLTQTRPKTVLAWSTVSQMGILLLLFAATLGGPLERELLLPVIGLWVLHHGLNKAALFLATGCAPTTSVWRLLLLALPALSLAGLPLTSGALAKYAAKDGLTAAHLPDGVILALTVSSVTTALLLLHFHRRLEATAGPPRPLHPAWVLMTLAGLIVPWLWAHEIGLLQWPDLGMLWDGSWPLLLAAALALVWHRWLSWPPLRLPEDEMLALGRWLLHRSPTIRPSLELWPNWRRLPETGRSATIPVLQALESRLATLPVAGLLLLAVLGLIGISLL